MEDYDLSGRIKDGEPKVVLNSILCPDSVIKIQLYWSKATSEKGEFRAADSFSGEILEDEVSILTFTGQNGIYRSGIKPKAGRTYSVKCIVPEYGQVKATTYIPLPPSFSSRFTGSRDSRYHHFEITSIELPEKCRAFWLNNHLQYENSDMEGPRSFYAINSFFDQVNSVNDGDDAAAKGSNIEFEDFIRIPYGNILKSVPATFSVWGSPYKYHTIYPDGWDDLDWDELTMEEQQEYWDQVKDEYEYLETIHLRAIAPSDDYDQYCKSIYKQQYYIYIPDVPWFNETVQVYTNIENGLGIFAGYSATAVPHNIDVDREEE